MEKFNTLLVEFIAEQWRFGIPLSRGLMAWQKWSEIFHAQAKAFQKAKKKKQPRTPALSRLLIPRSNHMDKILGESFSLIGGEPYGVAAALELIPAYLNFLEGLELIQSAERRQALQKIKPLIRGIPKIIGYYEGDPVVIENLMGAWEN
jgi:hypothetical protein